MSGFSIMICSPAAEMTGDSRALTVCTAQNSRFGVASPTSGVVLVTSKVWHVYSFEEVAGEEASQVTDVED